MKQGRQMPAPFIMNQIVLSDYNLLTAPTMTSGEQRLRNQACA